MKNQKKKQFTNYSFIIDFNEIICLMFDNVYAKKNKLVVFLFF